MSEITKAIEARQTQITQLRSDIEALQRAASIMGARAKATAKTASTTRPQPKTKPKQRKRPTWSAADKKAISKRMKAYWAKRRAQKG